MFNQTKLRDITDRISRLELRFGKSESSLLEIERRVSKVEDAPKKKFWKSSTFWTAIGVVVAIISLAYSCVQSSRTEALEGPALTMFQSVFIVKADSSQKPWESTTRDDGRIHEIEFNLHFANVGHRPATLNMKMLEVKLAGNVLPYPADTIPHPPLQPLESPIKYGLRVPFEPLTYNEMLKVKAWVRIVLEFKDESTGTRKVFDRLYLYTFEKGRVYPLLLKTDDKTF